MGAGPLLPASLGGGEGREQAGSEPCSRVGAAGRRGLRSPEAGVALPSQGSQERDAERRWREE